MNSSSSAAVQPRPNRFMYVFGGLILVGVGLYFLLMGVDSQALDNTKGTATVVGKEYREAGRTYTTEIIGGRTRTIPRVTSEMYILKLEINGRQTEAAVAKSLYDAINNGDKVQVVYRRRRITGALQVVDVIR